MSVRLPPISAAGFAGCVTYLLRSQAGHPPDPQLLCAGLPHGRIRAAAVARDMSTRPCIRMTLLDQHDGSEHVRYLNPEAFLVLRLLCLAQAAIRLDHNDLPNQLHYVYVMTRVAMARVIIDTPPGRDAIFIGDHHDLCIRNLRNDAAPPSATKGRTYRGRELAIVKALGNFDVARAAGILDHLPALDRATYEWLLAVAFGLLDALRHAEHKGAPL